MGFLFKGLSLYPAQRTHGMSNTNENGELTLRVPNGDYTIELFDDGVKIIQSIESLTANNEIL